jgi:hypothetical protein
MSRATSWTCGGVGGGGIEWSGSDSRRRGRRNAAAALRPRRLERRPVTVEDVMAVAKDRGGMALDRFVPSRPHRMPA